MRNYLLGVALILTAAACSKKSSNKPGTPAPTGNAAVTTVAGKPTVLSFGPGGITSDSKGNIFFAETVAGSIYKLTPNGTVSAYAGSDGNFGFDNGPGASATFTDPTSLVTDKNDNIYVADYLYGGIRKISSTDVVGPFASASGTGVTMYPQAICIDPQGNLYTSDQEGNEGMAMTSAGGVVTAFAGDGTTGFKDGPVAQAEFTAITGICTDGKGTIYIGDDGKIRKISGGQVTTIAGNGHGYADGKGLAAQFAGSMGLAMDSKGNMYIADTYNNCIRMMTPDLTVTTIAGGAADGAADGVGSAAGFYEPTNLCFDPTGNLYVADYGNGMIRKITFK